MNRRTFVCPNCGSKRVKVRSRRWYDGLLNFFDTMLTGAAVIRTDTNISAAERSAMDPQFMGKRTADEARQVIGRHTADTFWSCPDCKARGEGIS
jgi:hypothetical protein